MNNHTYLILLLPVTLIAGTTHQKHQPRHKKARTPHITKRILTKHALRAIADYDQQRLNNYLAHVSLPQRKRLMHAAISQSRTSFVKRLLRAPHALMHARDTHNRTLLQYAIAQKRRPVTYVVQKQLKQQARQEQTACSICFTEDKPYKKLFALPCCHTVLCTSCKDHWYQTQLFTEYDEKDDVTCPVCRAPMNP